MSFSRLEFPVIVLVENGKPTMTHDEVCQVMNELHDTYALWHEVDKYPEGGVR